MNKKKKPIVFVARSWSEDEQNQAINETIIRLIEACGIIVSRGMDKRGLSTIPLKEAMNIMGADAFCAILRPEIDKPLSNEIAYEISTAKLYGIPSFLFVDKANSGHPIVSGNIKGIAHGLKAPQEWFEFKVQDLLSRKEDENIKEYISGLKRWLIDEAEKIKDFKLSTLANLFSIELKIPPFHMGLNLIVDSFDKEEKFAYDIAAESIAMITGARMAFIGLLDRGEHWTSIRLSGMYGIEERDRTALKELKLGFNDKGESSGVVGHTALTGTPHLYSDLQKNAKNLKEEGINFIDPGDVGIESEACVPIIVKGKVVGVMDIEDDCSSRFKEIHMEILNWFSKIMSIVYVNDQLEAFISQLKNLTEIGKEKSFEKILETLVNWSQADFGLIAIKNENGEYQVVAIKEYGLEKNLRSKYKHKKLFIAHEEGIIRTAIETKNPQYVENVKEKSNYLPWWPTASSEIALPIGKEGLKPIGVIDLEYKNKQDFSNIKKELFESIANLVLFTLD